MTFGGIPHYCPRCRRSVPWEPVDSLARMNYGNDDMLRRPYRRYDLCSHCTTRMRPMLWPGSPGSVWRSLTRSEEVA